MLSLVQLALRRVFEGRERVGDETRLRLKVYESLGGLKGIVNEAGETALASLGEHEKARLPDCYANLPFLRRTSIRRRRTGRCADMQPSEYTRPSLFSAPRPAR
jgi:conflict system STAND superfamily ATPase